MENSFEICDLSEINHSQNNGINEVDNSIGVRDINESQVSVENIWNLNLNITPRNILNIEYESKTKDTFLKDTIFSPDGYNFLTNSDDNKIKYINIQLNSIYLLSPSVITTCQASNANSHILSPPSLPILQPQITINESNTIYSSIWYPYYSIYDYSTTFMLTSSKNLPIHLYNVVNGDLVASYCGKY